MNTGICVLEWYVALLKGKNMIHVRRVNISSHILHIDEAQAHVAHEVPGTSCALYIARNSNFITASLARDLSDSVLEVPSPNIESAF